MATSLVRGKYVVTGVVDDNASDVTADGAVVQRDGEIVDVGRYQDLAARHSVDEVIGDGRQVLMPGLINAHHHGGLTPFQMGSLDLALEPWIVTRMAHRDVDTYLDTLYCAIQMIESGITTVMHNHTGRRAPGESTMDSCTQALKAYRDSGMRVAFSLFHRDQNQLVYGEERDFLASLPPELASKLGDRLGGQGMSTDEYLALFIELYERYGRNDPQGLVRILLSPANVQWCSDDLLMAIKETAGSHDAGIHLHLQETIYQLMYGLRRFGKTPLGHLDELGFLGPEVSFAHGVWLEESDIDILAASGSLVCHNASSNLRLKSGVAPINKLVASGVPVAIGIDEAGINDDNDMLQEMRLVQKLHREPGVDGPCLTSHQVLRMATVNGAAASRFGGQVGALEPGMRADMILVNLDRIAEPYLDPGTDPVDAVLYRGRGLDVDTVIVNGEVVMRDRRITMVSKDDVYAELGAQLARDPAPHEAARRPLSKELYPYIHRFYQRWPLEPGEPHWLYNRAR